MKYWHSFVVAFVFSVLYGWLEYYYITAPLFVLTSAQERLAYPWWANKEVFLGFTVYHLTIMLVTAVFVTFIVPAFVHSLRIMVTYKVGARGGLIQGTGTIEKRREHIYIEYTMVPFVQQLPSALDIVLVFIRNLLAFALLEDIFWFIFNLALPIPILSSLPWYERLWQPSDWTCRFGYIPTPWGFVVPIWYVITAVAIIIIQFVLEIKGSNR